MPPRPSLAPRPPSPPPPAAVAPPPPEEEAEPEVHWVPAEPAEVPFDREVLVLLPPPRPERFRRIRIRIQHARPHQLGFAHVRETMRILDGADNVCELALEHVFSTEPASADDRLRFVTPRVRAVDVLTGEVDAFVAAAPPRVQPLVDVGTQEMIRSAGRAMRRAERAARASLLQAIDRRLLEWRLAGELSAGMPTATRLCAFRASIQRRWGVGANFIDSASRFVAALELEHSERLRAEEDRDALPPARVRFA